MVQTPGNNIPKTAYNVLDKNRCNYDQKLCNVWCSNYHDPVILHRLLQKSRPDGD